MTVMGMTAALLAGILSALSTFAAQSITHLDPIFSIVPATTLRSSAWGRSPEACFLLDHEHTGRARILIVQLQVRDSVHHSRFHQRKALATECSSYTCLPYAYPLVQYSGSPLLR